MKVNPNTFFKFHDGKFIVWNYEAGEQFELTQPYFERLFAAGATRGGPDEVAPSPEQIERELEAAGLIAASYPTEPWPWAQLAHIYHFGTAIRLAPGAELPRDDVSESYVDTCKNLDTDTPPVIPAPTGELLKLPLPDLSVMRTFSLWNALMARKTTREFTHEAVALEVVSNILYATFGAVHGPDRSDVEEYGVQSYGYRRTSPSAGSLQTTEPYLANFTIAGLPRGLFHYHSVDHTLQRIEGELPASDLGPLLVGQNFANDLAFAVFMVARLDKMWWKYRHSRSYRTPFLDIGHLSQTFHLASAAHSLKSWLTAVFYDDELARRLRLDTTREAVLFMVGAGHGTGNPLNEALLTAVRTR